MTIEERMTKNDVWPPEPPTVEIDAYTFHGLRLEGKVGDSLRVKVLDSFGNEVGDVQNLHFDGKALRGDVVLSKDDYDSIKEQLRERLFEMDGMPHYRDRRCCSSSKDAFVQRECECGGYLHTQYMYGSYCRKCENCEREY